MTCIGGKHTIPGPAYQPEKPPSLLSLSSHHTGSREASADIYIATTRSPMAQGSLDHISHLISLRSQKKVGEKKLHCMVSMRHSSLVILIL
jgi:hypothetical protein